MRISLRAATRVAAVFAAILGLTAVATAQSFPKSPGNADRSFPPGGVIDTAARVIESELGEELGQPVVIENKGGSGGNLGAQLLFQGRSPTVTPFSLPLTRRS